MAQRNQRKRTRRSAVFWPKLLTMAAVVAAVVLCIAIFFRASEFTVTGNVRYSAEEIIAASGIAEGDNLLMISKSEAAGLIVAKLPYVTQVQIHRQLPNSVVIEVVESAAAAVVQDAYGGQWLIAADGRVLEQADETAAQRYPQLTGLTAVNPQAGGQLQAAEEDGEAKVAAAEAVLSALAESSASGHIVSIDLEQLYSIRMMYEQQYEIVLGGTDDLTYKFTYLEQILTELAEQRPGAGGQIDLTLETDGTARFLPW